MTYLHVVPYRNSMNEQLLFGYPQWPWNSLLDLKSVLLAAKYLFCQLQFLCSFLVSLVAFSCGLAQ